MENNTQTLLEVNETNNKSKKNKPLTGQIQIKFYWIYLAGVFLILALPFLSVAPLFHPPDFAKSIVFRIIFSVLFFVFAYQIFYKKYDGEFIKKTKIILNKKSNVFLPFWLLISYLAVFFLATIFSLQPNLSLWGSPYRGGGFLTLSLIILFSVFIFFILKAKDWKNIWNFIFIVGILVSLLAIFQKFRLFSKYIVSYTWQPVSTMGGPMFLALFLVLLTFLPLSFAKNSKGIKRYLYLFLSLIFVFVIILSAVRAAFLGLGAGFLFFVFLFPDEHKTKRIKYLKILSAVLLILAVLSAFWLKTQPQITQSLKSETTVFGPAFLKVWSLVEDFSMEKILRSRGSGWLVGFRGLMDRPILGYGPENFSIAFDRHYNPNLPGISKEPGGAGSSGWWDRAHNFMLDISVSAGIPALLIYLLLFGTLFWQLQRIKSSTQSSAKFSDKNDFTPKDAEHYAELRRNQEHAVICHGIQATFIGYLATNFFNFDVFSTYLISFLLIGYSFFLISQNNLSDLSLEENKNNKNYEQKTAWKPIFLVILFFITVWFIWSANLKPLLINKEINLAFFLSENASSPGELTIKKNQCQSSIGKIEPLLNSSSILDNYLQLNYIDIINNCVEIIPEQKINLNYKLLELTKKSEELRPYYTRTWLYDGVYSYKTIRDDNNLKPEDKEQLIKRAYSSFDKAHQLSPKRQLIYVGWIKTDLLLKKYREAEKRADECLAINPDFYDCWWIKAIVYAESGQSEKATESIEMAIKKGYNITEKGLLGQLINIYGKLAKETNNLHYYEVLSFFYEKMIAVFEPKNFQNHASLAFIYAKLGKYEEARKEAEIVLELSPESRPNVEAFLKTLPR